MRTRMYLGVHVHLGMYTAVALLFHVSGSFRCALMGVPCHLRMLSIFSTLTTWWNWLIISPQAKRAKTDPHQGTPTRAHLQPPECASCITCTCACTCTWTSVGAQFVCVRVCVCVHNTRARTIGERANSSACYADVDLDTGVCEKTLLQRRVHVGKSVSKAPNQGLESSFCWRTAGQRLP